MRSFSSVCQSPAAPRSICSGRASGVGRRARRQEIALSRRRMAADASNEAVPCHNARDRPSAHRFRRHAFDLRFDFCRGFIYKGCQRNSQPIERLISMRWNRNAGIIAQKDLHRLPSRCTCPSIAFNRSARVAPAGKIELLVKRIDFKDVVMRRTSGRRARRLEAIHAAEHFCPDDAIGRASTLMSCHHLQWKSPEYSRRSSG